MNDQIAAAKRLSIVLYAMGRESGLWDFISATAKNALEPESVLVLSAAGQASFRLRHNQTDPNSHRTRRWLGMQAVTSAIVPSPRHLTNGH
jgi:hypothetical protein